MKIISEQVTDLLRQRVVRQLHKPGERLSIDQLVIEIGCSQTPIREALRRLQGEGLVSYRRNQGYHVTPLSDRELYEILDCRVMIETFAIRQIDAITDDLIRRLEATYVRHCDMAAQRRFFEQNAADRAFHETMVAASGNALLLRLFQSMNSHMRTMRLLNFGEWLSQNFEQTRAEHERILTGFQRRDKDEAIQAVVEHLHSVKERIRRLAPPVPYEPARGHNPHRRSRRRDRRVSQGRPVISAGEPDAPIDQGGLQNDERR
jgi:DNA-binding GntR family transcriptional regulator